jgi:hypothetical protein
MTPLIRCKRMWDAATRCGKFRTDVIVKERVTSRIERHLRRIDILVEFGDFGLAIILAREMAILAREKNLPKAEAAKP